MIRFAPRLRPVLSLFMAGNRAMLLGGALLSAAMALCGVALLGLSRWFISATALAGVSVATALVLDVFAPAAGIRFLALARTAARYGERLTTHDSTLAVLAELRERLFRGWARPGSAAGLIKRPARLLFRLTLDIDALDSLYLRVFVPLVAALLVALASGIAFGLVHPLLGATAALCLVLCGAGIPIAAAVAARKPAIRKAHGLEIFRSRVIDLVTGHAEWIMAGQLAERREGLAAADRYLGESDNALNLVETRAGFAFGVAGALLLSATLAIVALLAKAGLVGAPVAALVLLVAFAAMEPFAALQRGAVELGRTLLAARRIAPRLEPDAPVPHDVPSLAGIAARLIGVSVTYRLSCFLSSGMTMWNVGSPSTASGQSGKATRSGSSSAVARSLPRGRRSMPCPSPAFTWRCSQSCSR